LKETTMRIRTLSALLALSTALPIGAQMIPRDSEFQVKLLSPINTQTSRKGDKITAQVLDPAPFKGDILEGRIDEAKSGGKIKVLELKRNLKETLDGARLTAEDLLSSHPDIQFVWGSNDVGAIGAGLAAKAAGRKLIITGMNGSPEAVDAVKKGLITATWDANQNAAGELMVIHALQWLITGKKPPVTTNPFTRIDKSNASQYIPWPERAKVKR